ncbi:glycosyltransferase family 4 protein [Flavobacterium humi]|uniref:Glycosyltransferase n=1 Tax=Flavobacterium humi TaxID=2562683 RepID=A0A4Z0L5E1_9FLAO|nr:glycosyltransferase family 4 protein [Flavobacterium humi]TGD57168.1 glycosyltransferase [Flavobacterium humi]
MKILQVIDTLDVGGAEKVFVDMCNILHENHQDVTALFLLEGGILKKNMHAGIPFYELHRNGKWSLKSMYKCSTILKQFDIVHCHSTHVYRYVRLISRLFSLKNTRIIFQNHHGIIAINNKVPLFFTSILKPDYYIGVSDLLIQWGIHEMKIRKDRTFLLENIIIKQEIIKKTGILKPYDLLLVSNIKENKNQLLAVQVAEKLDLSLLLVGKVQDEKYNAVLHEASTAKVAFATDCDNVQPVLGEAKLGLHTSLYETGPLVLIEYLAQGMPFLSYETGEVAKMLKPYFPEYFIDNFDCGQWAERVTKLLSQDADTEKMQQVFEKYFGAAQYFNKLIAIYQCIKN